MQASDNDLDKLSKEAAEHFEPSGALPDWEKMDLLLNKHLPVNKEPRRRIFIWLFLLLLMLGGGYLFYTGKDEIAITEKKSNTSIKDNTAGTISPATPATPAASAPPKAEQKLSTNKDIVIAEELQKNNTQDKTIIKRNSFKNKSAGKTRVTISQADITENKASAGDDDSPVKIDLPGVPPYEDRSNQLNIQEKSIEPANTQSIAQIPQGTSIKQKASADSNKSSDKKTKAVSTRKNRFEFSLLYAPELTTIGWTNIDKPGSNYGLLVGYKLSKNLTIQTGFVKSKKNYTANEEDFKFDYSPTSFYKFSTVEGYCNMYEIPVNVKLALLNRKKYKLVGIAGLSSYFMTKEFYTYHYHNSMYDWSAQYSMKRNYWFSVATLAVGVEKDISKNFNIGITPFIKIPFTGMGKGEIKLQGAGINFLLTYRPPSKKR